MEDLNEIWQVEVGGQIYEAALAELPEWISEGSLHPGDKVRKGNLRWIEAGKVPKLVPFFNARSRGETMPVVQTVTDGSAKPAEPGPDAAAHEIGDMTSAAKPQSRSAQPKASRPAPGQCFVHPDQESVFVCSQCTLEFCRACPKTYSTVRICPECGSFCKTAGEAAAAAARAGRASSSTSDEPFGISDLAAAIAYPFRFKQSLLLGGLMFMTFTLGQAIAGLGGVIFVAASLFCVMLANMLTFGVLANTVQNFTQGDLDADFLPRFDDFSLWDDVIHPFFLSIGVYLTAFGPFFLAAVIGVYMILSSAGEQMKRYNDQLTRLPGTEFYRPDRTAEQSQEVRELLERVRLQNERRLERQKQMTEAADSGNVPSEASVVNAADEGAELERYVEEAQRRHREHAAAPGEAGDMQMRSIISGLLRLAAPLAVIWVLTLIWGLFYFPAACAVAAYSRSFAATINPLVGLDTIKRLGMSYVKLLLMFLLILIMSGVAGLFVQLIFLPFNLPAVGNIPATVVGSFFTFYFSVVFSCLLGFLLFKSADRLKLYR